MDFTHLNLKTFGIRYRKFFLAAWKVSNSKENIQLLAGMDVPKILFNLLSKEDENILANVTGALSELLKEERSCNQFRAWGGIPLVVDLLNHTFEPILENVPLVLKTLSDDPDSMVIIEEMDGIRLVWSLLRHKSTVS